LIVFISIWVEEWDRIVSFITRAGLVTGILNLVMIFLGYYVAKMFVAVTIPVIFGMIVRALMTDYIVSKTLLVQRLSLILFLVVFTAIWVEEWDRIYSFLARAGLIALILNLTMIFLGYYLAKYLTSGVEQRKCISLECGLQNGTLAVFVGTQLFDNVVFMVPTAAYALIMFTTATIFVLIVRKIN